MDPHRTNMDPWYLNYYGSQCYQDRDQGSPSPGYYDSQIAAQQHYFLQFPSQQTGADSQHMLPHTLNTVTTSTSVTSIEAAEDQTTAAATGSTENTKKGAKRKNAKYETFPFKEEQYLVNLWKENFEQLESKNSRKVWTKIVDELNAQFGNNRTVDKCMRKMKYIIDKYKEKKDWNRKQTGGHLRKSPFYDEIDEILGCRDFVTFNNVKESASSSSSSAGCSSSSSPSSPQVLAGDSNCDSEKSPEEAKDERKQRKKRRSKAADREEQDDAIVATLGHVKDQGDQLTSVLTELQRSNAEQTKMMSQFMGAMLEALKTSKNQ